MDNQNHNDEENDEDFMDEINIKELERQDFIYSCETAYHGIVKMGFDKWFGTYIYQTKYENPIEGKMQVINNLIEYFESIEEYERCGYLKTSLDHTIADRTRSMANGTVDDDFYAWRSSSTA